MDPVDEPEEDRLKPVEASRNDEGPGHMTWAFIQHLVAGAGFEPATFGL
jgi:hypothetical protein